jgi:hypothetical protein
VSRRVVRSDSPTLKTLDGHATAEEDDTFRTRLVHIRSFPEEESQMFRMTRIVPTTVLTVAALALVAPAAQAKPLSAPSGGPGINSVVVTTGDKPLANPVQLPQKLTAGLMHSAGELMHPSTVQVPIGKIPTTTPVTVPDSSGNGFDWTAAAIGAGVTGTLMLMLAGGVGFRRRGQLAA